MQGWQDWDRSELNQNLEGQVSVWYCIIPDLKCKHIIAYYDSECCCLEHRVTMPPYGAQFRDFFKQSESSDFQMLGERVKIVPSAIGGIQESTTLK